MSVESTVYIGLTFKPCVHFTWKQSEKKKKPATPQIGNKWKYMNPTIYEISSVTTQNRIIPSDIWA